MSSFSGFDSTPMAITTRAMSHNFTLEERYRREEAQLNKEFYFGKQEHVLSLVTDDVDPVVMNLTKPIVGKRSSMLYSQPLRRAFEGPTGSVNFLEKVYAENDIDQVLKRVDLLSELTGSCLVHPNIDEDMPSGIRLLLWDGTQFSGIGRFDDPMVPEAVSLIRLVDTLDDQASTIDLKNPHTRRVLQQQVWTPDAIVRYDGSMEEDDYGHQKLVSSETNELGFIPFVNFMGEEVPDQFVGSAPGELVRKANHHINQSLTHIMHMIKMQSHTPIVFQGMKKGESIVVHPGQGINIPADAAASTLALNPKINETLAVIEFLEDRIYTTSSVPRISVEGGEGESGRELMIRWHPLLQVFHEKSVRFNKYELDLANMILAVAGYEPIEHVDIEWPEDEILPLSQAEDTLERDIQLNIKTPADEITRRHPDLTEEEALEELAENVQINSLTFTNDTEAESEDSQ